VISALVRRLVAGSVLDSPEHAGWSWRWRHRCGTRIECCGAPSGTWLRTLQVRKDPWCIVFRVLILAWCSRTRRRSFTTDALRHPQARRALVFTSRCGARPTSRTARHSRMPAVAESALVDVPTSGRGNPTRCGSYPTDRMLGGVVEVHIQQLGSRVAGGSWSSRSRSLVATSGWPGNRSRRREIPATTGGVARLGGNARAWARRVRRR
jgi:hypothetical protein